MRILRLDLEHKHHFIPLLGFFTWKQQTHNNFCKRWTSQYQLTTTGAGSEGVYNLNKSYNSLRASPESKHQYWCLLFQCLCRDLCSRVQCAWKTQSHYRVRSLTAATQPDSTQFSTLSVDPVVVVLGWKSHIAMEQGELSEQKDYYLWLTLS